MQQLTTNKLFYNKYRYKIECNVVGIGYRNTRGGNRPDTRSFYNLANTFLKQDNIKTRCENNTHSFFFNDERLIKDLKDKVGPWIVSLTSPANPNELAFLESDGLKKVICDVLPRGGFQYKIHIKSSMPSDARVRFVRWAEANNQITYSGKTESWLNGVRVYYPEPFIYVKDSKTLSMVLLMIGNDCRKIEEYITRSSINT
jgi:hypothetical protein